MFLIISCSHPCGLQSELCTLQSEGDEVEDTKMCACVGGVKVRVLGAIVVLGYV